MDVLGRRRRFLTLEDVPGLVLAVLLCEVVGSAPALFTAEDVATWYPTLVRPWFTPPNWLFAPVWTVLFALLGVALYLVWREGASPERRVALTLFAAQFALNVTWTVAFFGARSPTAGLVVIVALWVAVLATVFAFGQVNRPAAALVVPYLLWVSFAGLLNLAIWQLN